MISQRAVLTDILRRWVMICRHETAYFSAMASAIFLASITR